MPQLAEHPTTAHEHARRLGALGLKVLPIKPGHKRPPMNSWQHAATDDADLIDNWYTGLYSSAGTGLALGPQPCGLYLFALDVDTHDPVNNGWDALAELEAEHGALPDTWRSLTGADGGHIILTAPAGTTVRNQQASGNRIAAGIDVRGDGGQIVVAPTVHPDTKRRYEWEADHAPWECEVAMAPDWLLELVREPDVVVQPERTRLDHATPSQGDSIAESVRDWWDWHHELSARGWTLDRTDGSDTYWVRPGKDARQGHSAVLHGSDVLVVFTTEIPDAWRTAGARTHDGSGYSFSPFGFIAATEHNGDRSQAARSLRNGPTMSQGTTSAPGPTGTPEEVADALDADWARHDVVSIARSMLAGEYEPEVPVHMLIEGSIPLFYRGRLHSIFGVPGGGKTWIALAAIVERLQAGDTVLFIDWEDAAQGTTARLVQLGATPLDLERFDYRNPTTSLALGFVHLDEDPTPWTMVVIDSAGEALAAQGVELNDDTGTAQWMQMAKRLARRAESPSIVMLDHIPKANEAPAKYAIGSQRKLAAITGAAYRCDTIVEPAKGKDGKLKLVVAKDRLGNRAKGATACEIHMHDEGDSMVMRFTISEAQAAVERGGRFRPTFLMERISRWIELNPGSTQRAMRREVTGKASALLTALEVLVDEGWVVVERDGQSHTHTVVRPFREDEDPGEPPVDNSSGSPVPNRFPTGSPVSGEPAETDRFPRFPGVLNTGNREPVRGVEELASGSQEELPVDNSDDDEDDLGLF